MANKTNEEKMIHIVFPFNEDAPDTLYYSVNGRDFYIDSATAMSEGVDVPECLYEVITNANAQVFAANKFQKELQSKASELFVGE